MFNRGTIQNLNVMLNLFQHPLSGIDLEINYLQ